MALKILIFIWTALYADSDTLVDVGDQLFQETIEMLCKYSSSKGDFPEVDAEISSNVYKLIYVEPYCFIEENKKHDLINMLLNNHRQAYLLYRTYVIRDYEINDNIHNNVSLLIPLMCFKKCNKEIVESIVGKHDKDKLINEIRKLDKRYHSYYEFIIEHIYNHDYSGGKIYIRFMDFIKTEANYNIIYQQSCP